MPSPTSPTLDVMASNDASVVSHAAAPAVPLQPVSANAELAFVSFLQSEYMVLANDCRRKLPVVKTMVEEGVFGELRRLKELLAGAPDGRAVPAGLLAEENVFTQIAARQSVFVAPLHAVVEAGFGKAMGSVAGILQRLCVNYESLDMPRLGAVLDVLEAVADGPGEELQLKTLQSVVPMVTGRLVDMPEGALPRCLQLVFRLMLHSRHSTIRNTALAVLRQLVIVLFGSLAIVPGATTFVEVAQGKAKDIDSLETGEPSEATAIAEIKHAADAHVLLNDICASYNDGYVDKAIKRGFFGILGGDSARDGRPRDSKPPEDCGAAEPDEGRRLYPKISRTVALELVESVLLSNRGAFERLPSLLAIVRERLCTTMVKRLESADFAENARLWRICACLLHQYYGRLPVEGEIFVSFAVRILDDVGIAASCVWKRVLAAEAVRELLLDMALVAQLHVAGNAPHHPLGVQDMLQALGRVVDGDLPAGAATSSISMDAAMQLRVPYLAQFDKTSPPAIPPHHLTLLAHQSMHGLLVNLAGSADACRPVTPGGAGSGRGAVAFALDRLRLASMLQQWWPVLLETLARIFRANIDLAWRLELLSSMQTLLMLLCRHQARPDGQRDCEAGVDLGTAGAGAAGAGAASTAGAGAAGIMGAADPTNAADFADPANAAGQKCPLEEGQQAVLRTLYSFLQDSVAGSPIPSPSLASLASPASPTSPAPSGSPSTSSLPSPLLPAPPVNINEAAQLHVARTVLASAGRAADALHCADWRIVFGVVAWVDGYALAKSKRLTALPQPAPPHSPSATSLSAVASAALPALKKSSSLMAGDESPAAAGSATTANTGAFGLLAELTELAGAIIEGSVARPDGTFVSQLQAALASIPDVSSSDRHGGRSHHSHGHAAAGPPNCLYGLQKLRQLIVPNCHRFASGSLPFTALGDVLLERFLAPSPLCSDDDELADVRAQAMDILCLAAVKTLAYDPPQAGLAGGDGDKASDPRCRSISPTTRDKVQAQVLAVLAQSARCSRHPDSVLTLLDSLGRFLGSHGERLSLAGWRPLLFLLDDFCRNCSFSWWSHEDNVGSCDDYYDGDEYDGGDYDGEDDAGGCDDYKGGTGKNERLAGAGLPQTSAASVDPERQLDLLRSLFTIVKIVSSEFAAALDDGCMCVLVGILRTVAAHQHRLDLNIALTAVGLLWDLADRSLHRCGGSEEGIGSSGQELHQPRNFELWKQCLWALAAVGRLPTCTDVRNSALTSVFRAISEGGGALQRAEQWLWLYGRLIVPLLQSLYAYYRRNFLDDRRHGRQEERRRDAECRDQSSSPFTQDTLSGAARAVLGWSESLTIALEGSGDVFRRHYAELGRLLDADTLISAAWLGAVAEPAWLYLTSMTFEYDQEPACSSPDRSGSRLQLYQSRVVACALGVLGQCLQTVGQHAQQSARLADAIVVRTFELVRPLDVARAYYEQAALVQIVRDIGQGLWAIAVRLSQLGDDGALPCCTLDAAALFAWRLKMAEGALRAPLSACSANLDDRLNDVERPTDAQRAVLELPGDSFLAAARPGPVFPPTIAVAVRLAWLHLVLAQLDGVVRGTRMGSIRQGDKRPTLIAWSAVVLAELPRWFCKSDPAASDEDFVADCRPLLVPELYSYPLAGASDAETSHQGEHNFLLLYLFQVLARWLATKHETPRAPQRPAPWREAYRATEWLLQALDYELLTLPHWSYLLGMLIDAVAALPSVAAGPDDAAQAGRGDAIEADEEEADIAFLRTCIGRCVLPHGHRYLQLGGGSGGSRGDKSSSGGSHNLMAVLLQGLERCCRFVQYVPPPLGRSQAPTRLSINSRLAPVPKERVAQHALALLLAPLHDKNQSKSDKNQPKSDKNQPKSDKNQPKSDKNQPKSNKPAVPVEAAIDPSIARLALRVVLTRASRLLQLYVKEARLHHMPWMQLPLACTDELCHWLALLVQLRLRRELWGELACGDGADPSQRAPAGMDAARGAHWHLWLLYEDLLDAVAVLRACGHAHEHLPAARVFWACRAILRALGEELGVLGLMPRWTIAQSYGPSSLTPLLETEETVSAAVYEHCLFRPYAPLSEDDERSGSEPTGQGG